MDRCTGRKESCSILLQPAFDRYLEIGVYYRCTDGNLESNEFNNAADPASGTQWFNTGSTRTLVRDSHCCSQMLGAVILLVYCQARLPNGDGWHVQFPVQVSPFAPSSPSVGRSAVCFLSIDFDPQSNVLIPRNGRET